MPIFIKFGLYRTVIRYLGFDALWEVFKAVSLYALIWGLVGFMAAIDGLPRSVILINWVLSLLFISGIRLLAYWYFSDQFRKSNTGSKNVIIYGAGSAGRQLAVALDGLSEYYPVAYIDNNINIINRKIRGIQVHSPEDIQALLKKFKVSEILIAIPSISRQQRQKIISSLDQYPVSIKVLPEVSSLASGKVRVQDLHKVDIKDLLGRDKVKPNEELLCANIKNKVVMVTGAGGSIGSELCRKIVSLGAKKLILFDQGEFSLYTIEQELSKVEANTIVVPILGSVINKNRLKNICHYFDVQTIYHAAAYKHVPMVESNSTEGVVNNIFGTLTVAEVAMDCGVETFVLISTDKAVRPTNTMGATKRVAELILQAFSADSNSTLFAMVRFGNVLDSSGSVVPLFDKQIKAGGPVTVTDIEITRYFMTIPEAVELVVQAGAMTTGGDVFVLDMGELVKIDDLARKMIHLSGLEVKDEAHPDGDIEINYTGLRPGEKLYEELLIDNNVTQTKHPLIMRAEENSLPWDELKEIIDSLRLAVDSCDQKEIRKLLIRATPGFSPQCDIVDSLYNK
jgi:FlaA1/EpsC-like NDP-sugar epimerase